MKNIKKLPKGLIVQLVLVIILAVLMILSFFFKICLAFADLVAAAMLFVMVYNKRKTNKKQTNIILIIFGILFIFLGIYNFING